MSADLFARAEELLGSDAFAARTGVTLVAADAERVAVQVDVRKETLNGLGMAHGALVFLLADVAFALACNLTGASVSRSGNVEFLAPARLGDRLEATACKRSAAGRTALYDVVVRRPVDDTVIAELRAVARRLPTEAARQ